MIESSNFISKAVVDGWSFKANALTLQVWKKVAGNSSVHTSKTSLHTKDVMHRDLLEGTR